jgi:hypothetical protein
LDPPLTAVDPSAPRVPVASHHAEAFLAEL